MSNTINTKNSNGSKKHKVNDDDDLKNLLNDFELVKVLSEDSSCKIIRIHAKKKNSETSEEKNGKNEETSSNETAVIILEKPHFSLDETKSLLETRNPQQIQLQNDIYNKFSIYPSMPLNNIECQLIYPATEAHLKKYSMQELFLLKETYQDWLDITLKFIEKSAFSHQWVYNILEHKEEKERIIYEDPDPLNGFILLPDMKWDSKIETLYMLAIVHQRNIYSLRSLTGEHVKLLESIRDKSLETIESKYGVKKHKIRGKNLTIY